MFVLDSVEDEYPFDESDTQKGLQLGYSIFISS